MTRGRWSVTPIIEARGLDAGYNGIPVVRGVNISVEPGEVVALLGPNGAGKTTTLLTLSGDLPLLSGSVIWDGAPSQDSLHRRARRGLSLVTEERSVFMRLSTRDNLRLGRVPVDRA